MNACKTEHHGPRRRSASAAATALAAALLAGLLPAAAGAEGVRVAYKAHVGGLNALAGQAELMVGGGRYSLRLEAETAGMIGSLLSWRSELVSRGTVLPGAPTAGSLAPERHELSSLWRGEPREVALRYDGLGAVTVTVTPTPEEDERDPVPEELRRNTLDPMTAFVAVMLASAGGQGCERTLPIFDGRRRYDMIVTDMGMREIAPSSYSVYAGPARQCRVSYKPIAGYSRKPPPTLLGRSLLGRGTGAEQQRPPVDVWLAPVAASGPPVPVRIEADSGLGGVVVHLTEAGPLPAAASPSPAPLPATPVR